MASQYHFAAESLAKLPKNYPPALVLCLPVDLSAHEPALHSVPAMQTLVHQH